MPHAAPQLALLRDRLTWLRLCHAEPAACMNCLHTIAEFLAGEMDHDLQTALNKSTESYQAELGANRCTLEQARVLRFLTCSACIAPTAENYFVADDDPMNIAKHVDRSRA